jgi:hypothetical protein
MCTVVPMHDSRSLEDKIGTMLPCSVVMPDIDDGKLGGRYLTARVLLASNSRVPY